MTSFGTKLQQLRESVGLSQYALAKIAGVSKQALSMLESGKREPVWETVQRLALALGTDCTAFADAKITLPEEEPAKPRGRPRRVPAEETSGKKQQKRKGA